MGIRDHTSKSTVTHSLSKIEVSADGQWFVVVDRFAFHLFSLETHQYFGPFFPSKGSGLITKAAFNSLGTELFIVNVLNHLLVYVLQSRGLSDWGKQTIKIISRSMKHVPGTFQDISCHPIPGFTNLL